MSLSHLYHTGGFSFRIHTKLKDEDGTVVLDDDGAELSIKFFLTVAEDDPFEFSITKIEPYDFLPDCAVKAIEIAKAFGAEKTNASTTSEQSIVQHEVLAAPAPPPATTRGGSEPRALMRSCTGRR